MEKHEGVIEKRSSGKVLTSIKVSYAEVPEDQVNATLVTGQWHDLTKQVIGGTKAVKDSLDLISETIKTGEWRITGDKQFTERRSMLLELLLPQAPIPIRVLSVITHVLMTKNSRGKWEGGLRFFAINREDGARVDRHLAKVRAAQASQQKP